MVLVVLLLQLLLQELAPLLGTLGVDLLVVGHRGLAVLVPGVQLRLVGAQVDLVGGQNGLVGRQEGKVGDGRVVGTGDESGRLDEVPEPAEDFVELLQGLRGNALGRPEENGNLKVK